MIDKTSLTPASQWRPSSGIPQMVMSYRTRVLIMDRVRWRLEPGLIMRRERIAANQRFHSIVAPSGSSLDAHGRTRRIAQGLIDHAVALGQLQQARKLLFARI